MKVATVLRGAALVVIVGSCAASGTDPVDGATRTYRMGFSSLPPRLTIPEVLQTIDSITRHGDAALMVVDVPWAALLADSNPSFLIGRDQFPIAQLYKQRAIPLVATIEPANGLDRSAESDVLVKLGRSIKEPAVQRVYREYAVAFDSILHPTHLTLAVETNLIRLAAPAATYNALVTMTNAAAQQIRATGSSTQLMVSVQVDVAWGKIGSGGGYVGIDRDRADFPFIQALGLSSYPYLSGFATPEEIPVDYYSRLVAGRVIPMLVVEGGWSSGSVTGVTSSPDLQARYIRRQMQLADNAKLVGVFQITFTDFEMASFPVPPGSILPLFAQLGLVDVNYHAKPALAVWDGVRGRLLVP
jgi:hypothetical protein